MGMSAFGYKFAFGYGIPVLQSSVSCYGICICGIFEDTDMSVDEPFHSTGSVTLVIAGLSLHLVVCRFSDIRVCRTIVTVFHTIPSWTVMVSYVIWGLNTAVVCPLARLIEFLFGTQLIY